jgi:hypothetical protein
MNNLLASLFGFDAGCLLERLSYRLRKPTRRQTIDDTMIER